MYAIRQKNELCGKILKHDTLSWLRVILLNQEMLSQEAVYITIHKMLLIHQKALEKLLGHSYLWALYVDSFDNVKCKLPSKLQQEVYEFSVASAKLWHALPLNIRSSDILMQFKRNLKTHLFRKAFY